MNWYSSTAAAARADLLLIHGMIVSSSYMIPTAEKLADRYNCFVPDLLGRGLSDSPDRLVTIVEQAEVLAGAVHELGLRKPVIVGGSQGAHVAVEVANLVDCGGLILIGPTNGGEMHEAMGRLSADAFREPPELVTAVMSEILRIGVANVKKYLDDTLAYPFHDRLKQAGVPTLLITGEHDPFLEADFIHAIQEAVEMMHGICIRQVAHGLPFSEPEIIAECIHAFVESLNGSVDGDSALAA